MTRSLARLLAVATTLAGAACTAFTSPEDGVRLRTEVLPATARAGDTVRLLAVLTNPTRRRANLNAGCGPPVLFEVTTPGGSRVYPIPLDAMFTCPLLDVHELAPGETDTVAVLWRAPSATGGYAVRAGFRAGGRLERLTAARLLEITP